MAEVKVRRACGTEDIALPFVRANSAVLSADQQKIAYQSMLNTAVILFRGNAMQLCFPKHSRTGNDEADRPYSG